MRKNDAKTTLAQSNTHFTITAALLKKSSNPIVPNDLIPGNFTFKTDRNAHDKTDPLFNLYLDVSRGGFTIMGQSFGLRYYEKYEDIYHPDAFRSFKSDLLALGLEEKDLQVLGGYTQKGSSILIAFLFGGILDDFLPKGKHTISITKNDLGQLNLKLNQQLQYHTSNLEFCY